MAITPIRIPNFQQSRSITDRDGRPSPDFLRYLNKAFQDIQNSANAVIDAQNAADAANAAAAVATAAAATANNAANASAAESSIVSSFVKDFAGVSPLEADNTGGVTIASHTRQYGDTTLNPDVLITGNVLATGGIPGDIVRIYYIDPTRADTTPTFLSTIDPATQPVQGGDTHVIGAVEIPAAGVSDGGFVRPPGYTGPIP